MPPTRPRDVAPLLRLALVPGVGPTRLAQLMECFGDAERVLTRPPRELRGVPGIGAEIARRIREAAGPEARREAERAIARLERMGACILTIDDEDYPDPLRGVVEPPYLLSMAGDIGVARDPGIAVVGTRLPTPYGREAARRLSRDLSLSGFAIISGMARGIDGAAHLGALDGTGRTLGVLGHGIDRIYPPEARKLFDRVRERGLLLTEYAPGETPRPGNFPRRNRLITALAEAVLVVEMGHRSGAQHTVGFALDQGREVMAVPGPIGSPMSAGTNQLLKEGARLVTSAADVVEELRGVGSAAGRDAAPPTAPETRAAPPSLPLLTGSEGSIYAAVSALPTHVDRISAITGQTVGEVLAILLELELQGLVRSVAGKRFVRADAGEDA